MVEGLEFRVYGFKVSRYLYELLTISTATLPQEQSGNDVPKWQRAQELFNDLRLLAFRKKVSVVRRKYRVTNVRLPGRIDLGTPQALISESQSPGQKYPKPQATGPKLPGPSKKLPASWEESGRNDIPVSLGTSKQAGSSSSVRFRE